MISVCFLLGFLTVSLTRTPFACLQGSHLSCFLGMGIKRRVRTVLKVADETRYQRYQGELHHAYSLAPRAEEKHLLLRKHGSLFDIPQL